MKEYFLHQVWRHKLFANHALKTTENETLEILNFGSYSQNSGPDFTFAKIKIDQVTWVGPIEIHVKNSDWDLHHHSNDEAYDNVILHVIYEMDKALKHKKIPTLELKNYISPQLIAQYEYFINNKKDFIPCANDFHKVESEKRHFLLESMLIEKLQFKIENINQLLISHKNNWEKVFFIQLAYAFGLKINAETFMDWSQSFDFKVLQKIQLHRNSVFALFFGQAGFLEDDFTENWLEILKKDYQFLQHKFQLSPLKCNQFKFFRLQPPNFPTLRLAFLAEIYAKNQSIFSEIIQKNNLSEIEEYFDIELDEFWDNHYLLSQTSNKSYVKKLSKDFIHRIILNTILPMKYAFDSQQSQFDSDQFLDFYRQIPEEKNQIIKKFIKIGHKPMNAGETQGILHLKKNYCDSKKCLNCHIGIQLLKNDR